MSSCISYLYVAACLWNSVQLSAFPIVLINLCLSENWVSEASKGIESY